MKTKIFLSIASFYGVFQCVRPCFYEKPNYDLIWLAIVLAMCGVAFFMNRKIRI